MSLAISRPLEGYRRVNPAAITAKHPIVLIGFFFQAIALLLCPYYIVRVSDAWEINVFMVVPVIWLMLVHIKFKPVVQIPQAIIGLMLLQVWSVIAGVVVSGAIGKDPTFDDQLLLFGNYAIMYLVSATLVALAPESRKVVFGMIFFFVFVSCTLGTLQFAHVGFALRIQKAQFSAYNGVQSSEAALMGVRASGFSVGQSIFGVYATLGFLMIASRLRSRVLKWWEWGCALLFGFGILACQTRSIVLPGALSLAVLTLVVLFKYRAKGALGVLVSGVVLVAILIKRASNFGFILSSHATSTGTLMFREQITWAQLKPIYNMFPWTGIGPDWRFAHLRAIKGSPGIVSADKWVTFGTFDGSYHHLLATLGIIGCVLFGLTVLLAFLGLFKVIFDNKESNDRRDIALAMVMMLILLIIVFATFEDLWWKESMWPVAIAFGLLGRTRQETLSYYRNTQPSSFELAWQRIKGVFRPSNAPSSSHPYGALVRHGDDLHNVPVR